MASVIPSRIRSSVITPDSIQKPLYAANRAEANQYLFGSGFSMVSPNLWRRHIKSEELTIEAKMVELPEKEVKIVFSAVPAPNFDKEFSAGLNSMLQSLDASKVMATAAA